jgi:hypothetical protein
MAAARELIRTLLAPSVLDSRSAAFFLVNLRSPSGTSTLLLNCKGVWARAWSVARVGVEEPAAPLSCGDPSLVERQRLSRGGVRRVGDARGMRYRHDGRSGRLWLDALRVPGTNRGGPRQ